ncbi:MAG TPA: universal stress protein [Longimicrobiales bacterium]|nr:universal stress protein [Longimicrobiales bacterium]
MADGLGPVLVGTDFSDTAALALQEAQRLAAMLGTGVTLMHVVDGAPGIGWGHSGEAGTWLERAGIQPQQVVVRFGSPWVEVTRYVSEVAPALVVVGSHGRSGYQPLTIGGTASRISMHSRVPVVLVSPRAAAVRV